MDLILARLSVPTGRRGERTTFRCPVCRTHRTTADLRANLAYCHRCQRSLNPIDLAMAVSGWSFLEAVFHLEQLLEHERDHAAHAVRPSCGPPPAPLRRKPREADAAPDPTTRPPTLSD